MFEVIVGLALLPIALIVLAVIALLTLAAWPLLKKVLASVLLIIAALYIASVDGTSGHGVLIAIVTFVVLANIWVADPAPVERDPNDRTYIDAEAIETDK